MMKVDLVELSILKILITGEEFRKSLSYSYINKMTSLFY